MTSFTQTSLSVLEQHTWASPLAPSMEPEEYVFILSCLQPYVDMARLCQHTVRKHNSSPNAHSIALALSCMNQYELRKACREWKAIIVHVDPECTALQRTISINHDRSHFWASVKAVVWSTFLTAVGLSQQKIIRITRWPTSRLASACIALVGFLFMGSCAVNTTKYIKSIPRGYDLVKVRNEEAQKEHLFLVRRDYKLKVDSRVAPIYVLSGLGLGTILLGTRIAFKIRRA
ncbi:hypothetical protein BGZ76_009646 [Entomortierella beljakovae]|nr:hypothetical protein BGZ76_009646 [Entomortierella beljakovae]